MIEDYQSRNERMSIIDPYYKRNKIHKTVTFISIMTVAGLLGIFTATALRTCAPQPVGAFVAPRPVAVPCTKCHNHKTALTAYFEKAGSRNPEAMAVAVLATKSPRLLAAIAKIEKTPHTARNTGWKGRYSGAWQTARHWGKVTGDVTQQALIAELALESHVFEEKNIIKGLNAYGGETDKKNGRYAYNVLAELSRVP